MIINDVFKDEVSEIRHAIVSITMEGCIQKYSDYIEKDFAEKDSFECKFIEKLSGNRVNFITKLLRGLYSKANPEVVLDLLMEQLKDGGTNLNDWVYEESVSEVLYGYFTDADIYFEICEEMRNTLNEMTTELSLSKAQLEQTKLTNKIKYELDSIATYEKSIEGHKQLIAKLEKDLIK